MNELDTMWDGKLFCPFTGKEIYDSEQGIMRPSPATVFMAESEGDESEEGEYIVREEITYLAPYLDHYNTEDMSIKEIRNLIDKKFGEGLHFTFENIFNKLYITFLPID